MMKLNSYKLILWILLSIGFVEGINVSIICSYYKGILYTVVITLLLAYLILTIDEKDN